MKLGSRSRRVVRLKDTAGTLEERRGHPRGAGAPGFHPSSHHWLWTGYDTFLISATSFWFMKSSLLPVLGSSVNTVYPELLFLLQSEAKGLGSWLHSTSSYSSFTTPPFAMVHQDTTWARETFPTPLHPPDVTKTPFTLFLPSKHLLIFTASVSAEEK